MDESQIRQLFIHMQRGVETLYIDRKPCFPHPMVVCAMLLIEEE